MNTHINNLHVYAFIKTSKWNKKVYKIRCSDEREAELVNLIEMINEETILVKNPLFSHETVGQNVYELDKFN